MEARHINPRTRLNWMDWAKATAIFIIVLGHLPSPIGQYLLGFSIPFFFMLSGYLEKKRSPKEEFTRSFKTILIPYAIYNLYLLAYSYFTGEYNSHYPLNMLLGMQWELSMPCRPLWFLLTLFWIRMLYSISPMKTNYVLAILFTIIVGILKYTDKLVNPADNYFQLFEVLMCFPFYMIGNVMKKYKGEAMFNRFPVIPRYLIILTGLTIGLIGIHINGHVNVFRCSPADDPVLFFLNATLVSISLICLIYNLLNFANGYICLVSEGTLLIFAVHQSILWPFHAIWPKNTVIIILIAFLTVAILSVFVYLAKKYCPVLIGKLN